jgi:hypothetical protein
LVVARENNPVDTGFLHFKEVKMSAVRLYDPHPGFAGAIIPLPQSLKDVADWLNGRVMALDEVIEVIINAAETLDFHSFEVKSHEKVEDSFITITLYEDTSYPCHSFRVISYVRIDDETLFDDN